MASHLERLPGSIRSSLPGTSAAKWRPVPSNTRVALFLDYFNASPSFRFDEAPHFELHDIDPEQTCLLGTVADPLLWVSQHLAERVTVLPNDRDRTLAARQAVDREHRARRDHIDERDSRGRLGSQEARLSRIGGDFDRGRSRSAQLEQQPLDGTTVAVFGSSHSAMIVLPNLLANPVAKVINFYRSPLEYAVYLKGWTLFDDVGLKGQAACWARENIDGVHPGTAGEVLGRQSGVRRDARRRATTSSTRSDSNAGNFH